jgi:hypothetical protein
MGKADPVDTLTEQAGTGSVRAARAVRAVRAVRSHHAPVDWALPGWADLARAAGPA